MPSISGIRPADSDPFAGNESFYEIEKWGLLDDAGRVAAIRQIVDTYSSDPRYRWLATEIIRKAGAEPRDHPAQAAALLAYVQHAAYYVNERDEQLQAPHVTLKRKSGDCDDLAILYATLCQSIGIPCQFVLMDDSGKRWIEGQRLPFGFAGSHIYCRVGWPFGAPRYAASAEVTVRGAPLGYDPSKHGIQQDSYGRVTGIPPRPSYGSTQQMNEQNREQEETLTETLVSQSFWRQVTLDAIQSVMTAAAVAGAFALYEKWKDQR